MSERTTGATEEQVDAAAQRAWDTNTTEDDPDFIEWRDAWESERRALREEARFWAEKLVLPTDLIVRRPDLPAGGSLEQLGEWFRESCIHAGITTSVPDEPESEFDPFILAGAKFIDRLTVSGHRLVNSDEVPG